MNNVEIVKGYRAAKSAGNQREADRFRTMLIQGNQGLVRRLVNRFIRPTSEADADDAMQAGSMGLLRALEDYDPEKSSFSTYAAHWIRDHMQRWGAKPTAVTRPRSALMPASVAKAAALFRAKHGKEPCATDLGVTAEQLNEWSEGSHFVYLDEDSNDEHGRNEIASDAAEAQHTIDRMVLEQCWDEVVANIAERNIQIAEAVMWRGETTVAVAEQFGLSQGMVVQICQRVEVMLKAAIEGALAPPSSKPSLRMNGPRMAAAHLNLNLAKIRAKRSKGARL